MIAVVGIRITARTQVAMAVVEYTILVGMSIWGLVFVLGHHAGTVPITSGWFSPTGIDGNGDLVGGFLIAVFAYSGWDGTIYVNEEVKHRRVNPGRAALIAVALLAVIYTLAQVGLQGVVSSKNLQANTADALVYVAQALGGSGWAKVMALVARALGDRDHRDRHRGRRPDRLRDGELPGAARVPQQRRRAASTRRPRPASMFGFVVVALAWVYLIATSVQNAFTYVVDLTGLLFAIFYVLTGLASIVYYRRRVFSNAGTRWSSACCRSRRPASSSGWWRSR